MSKKNKKGKDLVEDEILTAEKDLTPEENLNKKDPTLEKYRLDLSMEMLSDLKWKSTYPLFCPCSYPLQKVWGSVGT